MKAPICLLKIKFEVYILYMYNLIFFFFSKYNYNFDKHSTNKQIKFSINTNPN